jgi:hypothetical protein
MGEFCRVKDEREGLVSYGYAGGLFNVSAIEQ